MKKPYKIYSVIMFLLLFIPGILVLIMPGRDFSANENRYLDKLPEINAKEIFSGELQEKVSDAFNDQFILRDFMMGLSTSFKKTIGFKDIGGVYLAKDKYYIEKTTDHDIKKDQLVQNLMYLSYFTEKQKAGVYTMLVPSPGTVLSSNLPAFAPFYNPDSVYNTVNTILEKDGIIDLRRVFEKSSNKNFYFKTDHHWTLKGAYAAYSEYCKAAGLKPQDYNSFNPAKVNSNFYGTLYSKVIDFTAEPDSIYAVQTNQTDNATLDCDGQKRTGIYDKEYLDKKDKYAYFFGGNYGRADINTGSSTGLKLLVLKDSYANSFVPFLLKDYSQITMVDARYYNGSILDIASSGNYNHILVLYEVNNFTGEKNIYKFIK
ncbi:MAG: DHHW family protein [Lachnospiraceae bacterium]|nr:DHHW family protein [Lachnospiraceae bacterium]